MGTYALSEQARRRIYQLQQSGVTSWPKIKSTLRGEGLIQDMRWQHLQGSYEKAPFVPTQSPSRAPDPSQYFKPYDYNDPRAMEKYYEQEGAFKSDWDSYLEQKRKAQQDSGLATMPIDGNIPEEQMPDLSQYKDAATESSIYKGQVPTGSMVVDGQLVSQRSYDEDQKRKRDELNKQFPWLKPFGEGVSKLGQAQQPMGNIGAGAPMLGQTQMVQADPAPTVTPQGGTSATYNPLGGTQFKPNPYKTGAQREIPQYGGGNIGYGGGRTAPKY